MNSTRRQRVGKKNQCTPMGDSGFEPIFIEIKPSLRLSPDLDSHLRALAAIEAELGLTVVRRFIGPKYLELVSFPSAFTHEQALAAIVLLQEQTFVEQVTASTAANLVYRSGDFTMAYEPHEFISEAVRRGLDSGPTPAFDPSLVLAATCQQSPHRCLETGIYLERGAHRFPATNGRLECFSRLPRRVCNPVFAYRAHAGSGILRAGHPAREQIGAIPGKRLDKIRATGLYLQHGNFAFTPAAGSQSASERSRRARVSSSPASRVVCLRRAQPPEVPGLSPVMLVSSPLALTLTL